MQNCFMAHTAQTCVTMHNLYLLSYDNVAEYWKEGKDSWHCRFSVYDEERDMVDLEAIRKISDSSPSFVSMGDDDYFMTPVNKLA